jgi:hypothetical protein
MALPQIPPVGIQHRDSELRCAPYTNRTVLTSFLPSFTISTKDDERDLKTQYTIPRLHVLPPSRTGSAPTNNVCRTTSLRGGVHHTLAGHFFFHLVGPKLVRVK